MGGLIPTPANPTGPVYRAGAPFRDELALGRRGTPFRLDGRVLRPDATPVAEAVVDAWHTGPCGLYDLFGRRMRFRGRVLTGADGRWTLRTVVPGGYLWRPPHVHVRVWLADRLLLTTQLYLPGDLRLRLDPWVRPELILAPIRDGSACRASFELVVAAASRGGAS